MLIKGDLNKHLTVYRTTVEIRVGEDTWTKEMAVSALSEEMAEDSALALNLKNELERAEWDTDGVLDHYGQHHISVSCPSSLIEHKDLSVILKHFKVQPMAALWECGKDYFEQASEIHYANIIMAGLQVNHGLVFEEFDDAYDIIAPFFEKKTAPAAAIADLAAQYG